MIGERARSRSILQRAPARLPQTVLAVALFATLLVPATRQAHLLIVRVLFHLEMTGRLTSIEFLRDNPLVVLLAPSGVS